MNSVKIELRSFPKPWTAHEKLGLSKKGGAVLTLCYGAALLVLAGFAGRVTVPHDIRSQNDGGYQDDGGYMASALASGVSYTAPNKNGASPLEESLIDGAALLAQASSPLLMPRVELAEIDLSMPGDWLAIHRQTNLTLFSRVEESDRLLPSGPYQQVLSVHAGDTLIGMLQRVGVEASEAHMIVGSLKSKYDPRHLKPGDDVVVTLTPAANDSVHLLDLELKDKERNRYTVTQINGSYQTQVIAPPPPIMQYTVARGEITNSFFEAGAKQDVPTPVLTNFMRALDGKVNFSKDIRPGDKFEVLYEEYITEEGNIAKTGNVIYAAIDLSGKKHQVYRYDPKDGPAEYFDDKGNRMRSSFLRLPVESPRITSSYGMRHHPILKRKRMHTGTDFGAPTGTPVYAAGDGKVEFVGRRGGYGNYIRLRHNSKTQTAYAHLHRYAKGLRSGQKVSQGQIIGYVGSTGRSTGPHLHYEVMVNGKTVNPMKHDHLPMRDELPKAEKDLFLSAKAQIDQQFSKLAANLNTKTQIASSRF